MTVMLSGIGLLTTLVMVTGTAAPPPDPRPAPGAADALAVSREQPAAVQDRPRKQAATTDFHERIRIMSILSGKDDLCSEYAKHIGDISLWKQDLRSHKKGRIPSISGSGRLSGHFLGLTPVQYGGQTPCTDLELHLERQSNQAPLKNRGYVTE